MRRIRTNPKGFHLNQIPFYLVLVPLAAFMSLPIIFIINHAFKPIQELFAFPPRFFVINPSLDNFNMLMRTAQSSGISISRYLFNSVFVTIAVLVFSVLFSTMAAFALSKLRFRMKKIIFEINTVALMFVPIAVQIPRYLLIDKLGMIDTYFAHILPLLAMPVGLFLVKQFMDQVPDSLLEAAIVDGAGYFLIYRKIILPLIRPAIATIAILSFQLVWGNLETSPLYTTKENMRTLTFFMTTLANNTNLVAGQGSPRQPGSSCLYPTLCFSFSSRVR